MTAAQEAMQLRGVLGLGPLPDHCYFSWVGGDSCAAHYMTQESCFLAQQVALLGVELQPGLEAKTS